MEDHVMRKARYVMLTAALVVLIFGSVSAQTTAFTYQGRLLDSAMPPTANYDFEFRLYDMLSGGTQQGTEQTLTNVAVASGIFTVTLDFGAQFPGANRWLAISVKPAGGPTFTLLTPRQPVTSAPY